MTLTSKIKGNKDIEISDILSHHSSHGMCYYNIVFNKTRHPYTKVWKYDKRSQRDKEYESIQKQLKDEN